MARRKKMSEAELKKLTIRLLKGQCCENCEYSSDFYNNFHDTKAKNCYYFRKGIKPKINVCSHWKKTI